MRSTRGSIIDQALQRVGNTTATLKQAARFRLNRILQDLHLGADWPFLWTIAPVDLMPAGTITLPDDFVKPEDTESLVIETAGAWGVIHEVDHRTFYARDVTQTSTRPLMWTIDYTGPVGRLWPRPLERSSGSLRYKFLPPDMSLAEAAVYDADIPVFPWDTLLTDLLFEWAQMYEVDPRRGDQYQVNTNAIMQSRGASFPERSYPSQVPLDPLVFSKPWQGND
jgi:hypothetical protein